MRTFIAIEFPATIAEQLATTIDTLQQYLQEQNAPACLRWSPVQNIHLTLRFLGDTTPTQVQTLATGLRDAVRGYPPFEVTLGEIGGFPTLRQPRVVWVKIGGALSQLHALQASVEQAAQVAGFAAEERPFSAHVTLARLQRNRSWTQSKRVGELLQEYSVEKRMTFQVKEVVHMQSELRPSGAVYTPLQHFALAPGLA